LQNFAPIYSGQEEEEEAEMVPFVACGGEGDFDPDMNYNLSTQTGAQKPEIEESKEEKEEIENAEYKYLEPTQGPINPPYMHYM